jgi:hypothetical protein
MSLIVKEVFRVRASADRVWTFLKNPAEVVTCLPGAELTETIDERSYAGRVRVKVGPVSTSYAGRAMLASVDEAARRVEIVGEGKESGGAGSAKLHMWAGAVAVDAATAEVTVDATIDIAGRVMQFGRGLIDSVSRQLFQQFVEAATSKLEVPDEARGGGVPGDLERSTAASGATAQPERPQELRALPLLFRALWDWLRRALFARRSSGPRA